LFWQLTKLNLEPSVLEKLRKLTHTPKGNHYHFLGYSLDLDSGDFQDLLTKDFQPTEWQIQILSTLLSHYSQATQTPLRGKLVKFKDLPGGCAYEKAFVQRAVQPIAQVFGDKPEEFVEAAKRLGGKRVNFGDASVEISALEGVPLVYILWAAGEFPASASVLFDESASCFLPTEDLAGVGEITTSRLIQADSILKVKKIK
jgi:hypothetical protein